MPVATGPIGVFDSGVGGLSVLRALYAELPHEQFVYVADSGHAPYGEREDAHVIARSHAIADHLITSHHIKALVVACNTATAAAIHTLRLAYPALAIVGIEPALKPAAAQSTTGVVGVMATRGTLQSEKFRKLMEAMHGKATFVLQPCDGLADAIERADATEIAALCARFTGALDPIGINAGEMDTLVLGCTHYPFAESQLRQLVGDRIQFLEGGAPVARQTRRLLAERDLLRNESVIAQNQTFEFYATGSTPLLQNAVKGWLNVDKKIEHRDIFKIDTLA